MGIINSWHVYNITGLKSGDNLPHINFITIDNLGNHPIYTEKGTLIATLSSEDKLFNGEIPYDLTSGNLTTTTIGLYGTPGNKTVKIEYSQHLYNVLINIELRNCSIGERYVKESFLCVSCESFTYNFDPSQSMCTMCPNNANCDGNGIVPIVNYWHASPCSQYLEKCITHESCQYENRNEKLIQFSEDLNTCYLEHDTLLQYTHLQCQKVV